MAIIAIEWVRERMKYHIIRPELDTHSRHLILIYLFFFCVHVWVLIDNDEYVSRFDSKNSHSVAAPARIHYRYLIESICGCLFFCARSLFTLRWCWWCEHKKINTPQRCCACMLLFGIIMRWEEQKIITRDGIRWLSFWLKTFFEFFIFTNKNAKKFYPFLNFKQSPK